MRIEISKQTAEQLKLCELQILKIFISLCDEIGTKYFLIGGSLIGAVRHKGFIPWDDDIDVGMLRKDYNLFIKEAPKLMPDGFFLQTSFSDPQYPLNFAKIRNSETTFIEMNLKDYRINHGVFIDIFPFDYYPENKIKARYTEFKCTLLNRRIYEDYYTERPREKSFKDLIKIILSRLLYQTVKIAVLKKEKLIQSQKNSSLVKNYCGAWGQREIIPYEWVNVLCQMKFEDIFVFCPKEYDKYLFKIYGDYMTFPPEEERVGHHYVEAVDLNRSYTEYITKEKI